jgi:simple sugar transport system permease protein
MRRVVLERRAAPLARMSLGAPLLAVVLTLLASGLLVRLLGRDPGETFLVFFVAPLSTLYGVSEWLLRASPLILIALGFTVALRANVWNIGAEGMFIVGAIAATVPALAFGDAHPAWLLPLMMLAGMLGGMAWAAIPAFLKTRANVNEILVTLMLNYVAGLLLSYLVNGPLRDPAGFNYPQSAPFDPAALFTPWGDSIRLNSSILITLAALPLTWLLLERSFLGYRMTVSGAAPAAARYAGFGQAGLVWAGLLISGGTAGLAGMMEVAGPLGQLPQAVSPGYGFAAIIVAFIGRLKPFGILVGGLLLSLLYLGGEAAQMTLNLPTAMTRIFQGALLFFLLGADILITHRIRWRAR